MVVKTHKRSLRSKRSSKKSKSHSGKKTIKNRKVMRGGMPKFFVSSVPSQKKLEKNLVHSQAKQQYYNAQEQKYRKRVSQIPNQTLSQLKVKPLTLGQRTDLALLKHYTNAQARRPAKTAAIKEQISKLISKH